MTPPSIRQKVKKAKVTAVSQAPSSVVFCSRSVYQIYEDERRNGVFSHSPSEEVSVLF